VLLRTLLAHPALDLRVLASADDLDRRVSHVFTTDLMDPSRYVSGGYLVLSGLLWWRGPDDSEAFARTLAEAGVAALAAGTAGHGFVPDDLIVACRRHGLVLLEVPEHVSFATITELVVLSLAEETTPETAAEPPDLSAVLRRGAQALGVGCWLFGVTARAIEGSEPAPPLAQRQLMVRRGLASVEGHVTLTCRGRPYTVMPVHIGHPLAGWILAIADAGQWDRQRWRAVQETLAGARAELSRVDDEARMDAARRTAVLRALLTAPGPPPPDLLSRSDPAAPFTVLTASVTGQGPALATAILTELSRYLRLPATAAEVDGEGFALVGWRRATPQPMPDMLAEAIRTLEPGLREANLAVGVSAAADWQEAHRAVEEARYARRLAERNSRRASVIDGTELTAAQLLLAAVPAELRRSYRQRVLGPVLAYDTEHQSDLVESLRVFLDCSGSWKRAAQQLHLHVNTLRYRIERIGQLTGLDLTNLATQAELHIALRMD
jgi:hypothetical protein